MIRQSLDQREMATDAVAIQHDSDEDESEPDPKRPNTDGNITISAVASCQSTPDVSQKCQYILFKIFFLFLSLLFMHNLYIKFYRILLLSIYFY